MIISKTASEMMKAITEEEEKLNQIRLRKNKALNDYRKQERKINECRKLLEKEIRNER